MALDEALMARARRTGETVLRVYAWSAPTLSLGRNQRAAGLYDESALARRGIEVVRRPTGGRALLHHREVTYSVTAPVTEGEGEGEGVRPAYERINALLTAALAQLHVDVEIARPARRALTPSEVPCFAEPAAGELVLNGRKLVGSAQWRDDGALLQHGSILVDDDQATLPSLIRTATNAPPPPATLRAALGREPEPGEIVSALWQSVRSLVDPEASPLVIDPETREDATRLAMRYRDPTWTWRR